MPAGETPAGTPRYGPTKDSLVSVAVYARSMLKVRLQENFIKEIDMQLQKRGICSS